MDAKAKREGNVVIGFTSTTLFMLDVDTSSKKRVLQFAEEYPKFHKLGASLVMLTSDDGQRDVFGKKLQKYAIIFGMPMPQADVQLHVSEARRLGMCERKFTAMRKISYITIRVNAKNDHIPYPKIVAYYPSRLGTKCGTCGRLITSAERKRANLGVNHFLLLWRLGKRLGKGEKLPEDVWLPTDITIVRQEGNVGKEPRKDLAKYQ